MAKHTAPPRRRHSAQKHTSHKDVTLYTLGVLLVAVSVLLSLRFWPRRIVDAVPPAAEVESPAVSEELAVPEPQPVVTTLRFSATGDNLIHEPIYSQAARRAAEGEGYSFDYCYMNLLDFYAQQDINWINQETLCSKELAPSTYPCFSTPGECAEALYRAGFRVFSLSNNHTYDKGAAGIAATLRFWETMPEDVITTGLWKGEADYGRIPIQTVDGVKIAYLSYTEHTNGIPRNSKMTANIIYTSQQDVMEQQVRAARQEADFVVVGVHWGVEDSHNITQAQRTLAQSLADWGADVIIGTHPHVLQDAEWSTAADGRNVFVAYSLGNFLSTQSKPAQLIGQDLGHGVQSVGLDALCHVHDDLAVGHIGPGLCRRGADEHRRHCEQQDVLVFADFLDALGEPQLVGDLHLRQVGVLAGGGKAVDFLLDGRPHQHIIPAHSQHPCKGHAPGASAQNTNTFHHVCPPYPPRSRLAGRAACLYLYRSIQFYCTRKLLPRQPLCRSAQSQHLFFIHFVYTMQFFETICVHFQIML